MLRKILADGTDITAELNPRLMRLEITDEAGQNSDVLTLELSDDGQIKYPSRETVLDVYTGTTPENLQLRGSYRVTDVVLNWAPYTITVTATAARMRREFTNPRDAEWQDISLGELIKTLAERNGLVPAVSANYASIVLDYRPQIAQSDADFLTRLANEFDATFKVARGKLVFYPRGDGANVSGNVLPAVPITLTNTTQGRLTLTGRMRVKSVHAQYRDLDSAQTLRATAGSGTPERTLPGIYQSQDIALRVAQAELNRRNRREFELQIMRMPANPGIFAERLINVSGHFREEVNGEWVVEHCSETQDETGHWCSIKATKPRGRAAEIPDLKE